MTAENRVPVRLIFLIAAGLAVILVSLIIAWFGGTFLVNQYAQTKISGGQTRIFFAITPNPEPHGTALV